MDNKEFLRKVSDLKSDSSIRSLYWIAVSHVSREFKEFVSNMYLEDWRIMFDDFVDKSDFKQSYEGGDSQYIIDSLIENNKLGFIAEIELPEVRSFQFNELGKATSWSTNRACVGISYLYGDTLEDLVTKLEERDLENWEDWKQAELASELNSKTDPV